MTTGEAFRRRARATRIVFFTFGGLMLASVASARPGPLDWHFLLAGSAAFAGWATCFGSYRLGFRCPACRANLAPLYFPRRGMEPRQPVRACPHCGFDLDRPEGPT